MNEAQFGMIGLGTMGRNFLLNVAEHGFACVGYDLDVEKRKLLIEEAGEFPVQAADSVADLIAKLSAPRSIMLLVPAGPIVDSVIADLLPHLEKGDVIIDGGNSHVTDTERREANLSESGIGFLGVGVSGGEEGARHGPSIMPGGQREFYETVAPIFEAVAAKVDGEPCVAYMGSGSAGHFVKMVHNGIEYGLMQLIAETYDLLKRGYGMNDAECADLFAEWNKGELNSFLIEITSTVLRKIDIETGKPLVEMILDTAGQKGTGKWTSQAAMDFGVPIPTIDSAVTMRQISSQKKFRSALASELSTINYQLSTNIQLNEVRNALHIAFIIAYAQGLALLKTASAEKGYKLDLAGIAKIWRGGCIIRAALLEDIRKAFVAAPDLENLIASDVFIGMIEKNQPSLKAFVKVTVSSGIPCMSAAASLNYLNAFASERLPANLIQAQRDYFGAHTYQRIDEEGTFHTPDWRDAEARPK